MADIYWLIKESRLVGYANQARRLSGRTGEMSASQIEDALKSVSSSGSPSSGGLILSKPLLNAGGKMIINLCLGNIEVSD